MDVKEKKMSNQGGAQTILKDIKMNNYSTILTENPKHIDEPHWKEWVNSGVNYATISLNVESIHDSREVDKILSRNTEKRWKHSDNLIPCWQVSGLDPLTGERTLQGVQIKPDKPPMNKHGKAQKYMGATGYGSAPLFLDIGVNDYWQSIIEKKAEPVIITEGAKKAGAGLSIGWATVSIPGVSTCRKNGRLHEWIEALSGFGRTFYLCFDNDITFKEPVQNAMKNLARELCATGAKVMVIELPPGDFKGMDDFIANNGADAFNDLVVKAKTIEEWKQKFEELWQQHQQDIGEKRKSKIARYYDIVQAGWGETLRFNQLKNYVQLNDQPLDLNHIRQRIALEFDTDVPVGDSQAIVEMIALEKAFHPVVEYLDNLKEQYPEVDTSILDNLATRYFGSNEPLHNIYMKKTLIAAVARAKKPGSKHDTATILVGKQGAFKSTFWRNLFGDDWFCDELGDASEKDELMKLHSFWCLEWSEFETVYKRKDVSSLKKFMSSTTDVFRSPYGRTVKEYRRSCVLVGTTNETEILNDPTGNRRFWIIPVQGEIPSDLIAEERDRIWAAAVALYEAGHKWWLTSEEATKQENLNKEFQSIDPWTAEIRNYLQGREYVTIAEILKMLNIETARQDIAAAKRISSLLRQLGWKQGRKRVAGEPLRVWFPEIPESEQTPTVLVSDKTKDSISEPLQTENIEQYVDQVDHPQEYTQQDALEKVPLTDPGDPLKNPKIKKSGTLINLEIGSICYLENRRVKVLRLFKSVSKAEVVASGEVETFKVNISDLSLSPTTSEVSFTCGEAVTVIEGRGKGETFTVSTVDNGAIWLRKNQKGFSPVMGPYQPNQLRKA